MRLAKQFLSAGQGFVLREIAWSAPTVTALWQAIADALDTFTPQECVNYFTNSGYEPD